VFLVLELSFFVVMVIIVVVVNINGARATNNSSGCLHVVRAYLDRALMLLSQSASC
jgi:hypothetical protein